MFTQPFSPYLCQADVLRTVVFEAIIYVYKYEYDGYCESSLVTDLVTPDLVVTAAVGNKRNVIVTDRDAYHLKQIAVVSIEYADTILCSVLNSLSTVCSQKCMKYLKPKHQSISCGCLIRFAVQAAHCNLVFEDQTSQ